MRLREIRQDRGLSQKELAELSGVKQPMISNIETAATQNPGIRTVVSLCDALDCTLEEMIGRQTEGNG